MTENSTNTSLTVEGLREHLWHQYDVEKGLNLLGVDRERGLSEEAVAGRLEVFGANALVEGARRPLWRMFVSQFADLMILILVAAAVISGIVGEPIDSLAIVVIVVLNAVVGTVQEYRAERAMAALKKMAAPAARVIRDGNVHTIPAHTLVPGDIVLLEAGNIVPADLRLLESSQLQVGEAALTGESQAAEKHTEALDAANLPLGDRRNMAYKGTVVTRGRGGGMVIATGMLTELGKIATLLREAESVKTPLQKRLARFGQRLALAILGICGLIFAAGLARGEPVVLMFLTAVSLAVAAIPEALPAVVTVSLALGARKMSGKNALVRRLPAVETLGSVTFICSDKTGTLTENKMRSERVYFEGQWKDPPDSGKEQPVWERLNQAMALNNDSLEDAHGALSGDPTETALYAAALDAGYHPQALRESMPRLEEIPFDSNRKRMTTLHTLSDEVIAFTKGAPERVVSMCSQMLTGSGTVPMVESEILAEAEKVAAEGYRVLAFACRVFEAVPDVTKVEEVESDLTFLGLVALIDPPRREVPEAVADCRKAGITPVMITGDHPGTALAIARRLGIAASDDQVLTGQELEGLSQEKFVKEVESIRVYARVNPEQKIKIVRALQDMGEFTAMTGDGVNDAPALKRADIGVAMGLKGTDVARQAAEMVLLDDNFTTIVGAVREGRRIFDNIRKFIKYTMTSNSGEIWTLFLAPFLGLPIPLLPIHILWVNLVTDGLPGLALAAEPEERGIMKRPPRPPGESIFAHGMWQHMIWVGLLIGGLSILSQAWAYHADNSHWQTMVFTVLTFSQLFHVLGIRSERESIFSLGLLSNRLLLGAVLLTVALQLAVIYLPFLNPVFKTQPLGPGELLFCLLLSSLVLVAVECEKWVRRTRTQTC